MYKYLPGRMITVSEMLDDSSARKMFGKVHQLHAVVLPPHMERDAQNFDAAQVMIERSITLLKSEKAAILDKDTRVSSAGMSRKSLVEMSEKTLHDFKVLKKSQSIVLENGDLWMNNIIIDEQAGEVHLIDWDIIGVGAELIDLTIILARDPDKLKEEASLLSYQNEAFMDKRLMMSLETHPKYQGKAVDGDIFKRWKKLLLQTLEVGTRGQATVYFALAVQYTSIRDYIPSSIGYYHASRKYNAMLQKYMDAENC